MLHLRFFGARVAYADSFGWTFARRMASCSACVAHSVRTRTYLLAMPRLRAQRTVTRAIFVVGSMRVRSTVSANHRAYDAIMIRFRFSSFFTAALLGPPLHAPYYLLTQRPCSDLRCQALTYLHTCDDRIAPGGDGRRVNGSKKLRNAKIFFYGNWANPSLFFCLCGQIFCFRDARILKLGRTE